MSEQKAEAVWSYSFYFNFGVGVRFDEATGPKMRAGSEVYGPIVFSINQYPLM